MAGLLKYYTVGVETRQLKTPSRNLRSTHRRPRLHHPNVQSPANNRVTGGKVISSKTKPSASRAAAALRLAANALHRSDSALGAFLRRKKAQLGAPQAITATAHKLARIIYAMLRYGQAYVDAGAEYYESQYRQRALRATKRRAAQLGYQLVPISDAQAPVVPHASTAAVA